MFKRAVLLVPLLCFGFSLGLAGLCAQDQTEGQAPVTLQRDPEAVSLAQQALAAMGSPGALAAIRDSVAAGTVQLVTPTGTLALPVVLKSRGMQAVRTELQRPQGTRIRILNQGRGAIQKADGGVMQLATVNTVSERVDHIPALRLLDQLSDPEVEIEYVSPGAVEGRPADIIAFTYVPTVDPESAKLFRSFTRSLFYIDQATKLVTKMERQNFGENATNVSDKIEVFFADYRAVNGISVPFQQTTYTNGSLEYGIGLQSVAFNVGLSDSEFALPEVK